MHAVTLYVKAGCGLCDEARAALDELAADHVFTLTEVDIRTDDALFERYRYRIPVLVLDGAERLEGRIEGGDIAALLRDG